MPYRIGKRRYNPTRLVGKTTVFATPDKGASLYPAVIPLKQVTGDQTLTASLFTNSNTFYIPVVTTQYSLTVGLFVNSNSFYSEVVTASNTLVVPLIVNTNTFYNGIVTPGVVNLTASLFENSPSFYIPVVTSNYELFVSKFDNPNTIYSHIVTLIGGGSTYTEVYGVSKAHFYTGISKPSIFNDALTHPISYEGIDRRIFNDDGTPV